MAGPQHADGRPGGPAVPRDDRSEAADGHGDEDGPVRISGGQIDQRRRGRAEGDEHRVPVPPQQQAGAEDQQRPPERVQGARSLSWACAANWEPPTTKTVSSRVERHGHRSPRPPRPSPWSSPLHRRHPGGPCRHHGGTPAHTGDPGVRCSSMTVTLDGTGRRWRQPGEVITRTPHGVPPGPSTDHHPVVVRDRPCRSLAR